LTAVTRAAIAAADGGRLVDRALADPTLGSALGAGPVTVVAAGKAAARMAERALSGLQGRVERGLVTTLGVGPALARMAIARTEHPAPGAGSLAAGRAAIELVRSAPSNGSVLVLLSGGASSMIALPLPDVSLDDKARTTVALMRAGADIIALNTVRKHLSAIKGGRLAAAASGRMLALAISDVVGNDLSAIGSGPTVPDPSTFDDALRIVEGVGVAGQIPRRALAVLERGARGLLAETPKPGSRIFDAVATRLIGSGEDALDGAAREAARLGYSVACLRDPVVGNAREAGERLVMAVERALAEMERPACVLSSGETTVMVKGQGRGGRSQELALAATASIDRLGEAVMGSFGTDGIDGPTDAAGARVDPTTLERAARLHLAPPEDWFARNDTYEYFRALGDLIVTGPTGANVGDVQVVLAG
jgi:hydroxypyruvate reductase